VAMQPKADDESRASDFEFLAKVGGAPAGTDFAALYRQHVGPLAEQPLSPTAPPAPKPAKPPAARPAPRSVPRPAPRPAARAKPQPKPAEPVPQLMPVHLTPMEL